MKFVRVRFGDMLAAKTADGGPVPVMVQRVTEAYKLNNVFRLMGQSKHNEGKVMIAAVDPAENVPDVLIVDPKFIDDVE